MEKTLFISFTDSEFIELIKKGISEVLNLNKTSTNEKPPSEDLLNIEDVQKIFNVSKVTVHKWKKRGLIPFYKMNRKVYFKKSEVINALSHKKRKMEV